MMKATVAIWTKRDGVRNLVGTAIGQHLHMVHFEVRRAVVSVKRRLIGTRFTESLGGGPEPKLLPVDHARRSPE
jgi:hypothetical protein